MLPLETALSDMERLRDENVSHLIQFVRGSRRGFTREPRVGLDSATEESAVTQEHAFA
jgi:hypothetical protein